MRRPPNQLLSQCGRGAGFLGEEATTVGILTPWKLAVAVRDNDAVLQGEALGRKTRAEVRLIFSSTEGKNLSYLHITVYNDSVLTYAVGYLYCSASPLQILASIIPHKDGLCDLICPNSPGDNNLPVYST